MQVTSTGHAGLLIDTQFGSILCDPWRTPAYFASWFVFPDNSEIDFGSLHPDFLYISHLHRDHYDPDLLARCIPRSTPVLLPDFPTDDLKDALEHLGFHKFVQTANGMPIEIDGLRLMIAAMSSPADGPLGDSALAVDDGTARFLNQNDARPRDFAPFQDFGHFDGHSLQFSGAIWWPVVYELAEATKQAIGVRKRENGMARAQRFAETMGADWIFPNSGPPAFLDEDLYSLNDFDNDASNPFPDQGVFLDYLKANGHDNARLLIPGSTVNLQVGQEPVVTHALPEAEVAAIFADKRTYLDGYAARQRPRIEALRDVWPRYDGDLAEALADWFEPLLALADRIGPGVGGPVLLQIEGGSTDAELIVVEFAARKVRRHAGEECRYRYSIDRRLIEALIAEHQIDWVNSLFLSLRFRAARKGAYNEFIYTFFKCLAPERLSYAEGWYAEQEGSEELVQIGDYMVQRRCPHLKADLSRFGELHPDGVLQCGMHGWRFDLATGQCLTSDDHPIICFPVGENEPAT